MKKLIFNDFKFLIRHTNNKLNSNISETEKGITLISAYATANSLYEKFSSILLEDISRNYNNDLRPNSKKIFLLKYRDGKKLNNLNKNEIDEFLSNIRSERFHSEFKNTHKSLLNIEQLFAFRTISALHLRQATQLLSKHGLTLDGLWESLKLNYTEDRTRIIHGDYRDIKTIYFIFRGKYNTFLINLYIAMKILDKSL